MPLPLEGIQVVNVETEPIDHGIRSTSRAFIRVEQDFSFLNKLPVRRSVHYDIESIDDEQDQSLRSMEPPTPMETVLRRRYIAHWGLPGKTTLLMATEKSSTFLLASCENRMARRQSFPPTETSSADEFCARMSPIHGLDSQ